MQQIAWPRGLAAGPGVRRAGSRCGGAGSLEELGNGPARDHPPARSRRRRRWPTSRPAPPPWPHPSDGRARRPGSCSRPRSPSRWSSGRWGRPVGGGVGPGRRPSSPVRPRPPTAGRRAGGRRARS